MSKGQLSNSLRAKRTLWSDFKLTNFTKKIWSGYQMDLILEICCKNVTEKNHLTAWFKQAFHLQMSLVTKNERQGEIKVTKLC